MLTKQDYLQVYEMLTTLAPDFIKSALAAKVAPNTQEKQEYETKAAYVMCMFDAIKTMNNVRFSIEPQKPRDNTNRTNY